MSECTRLSIPFGVYFISYATNHDTFQAELDRTFEAIGQYHLDYPVVMDIETDESASVDKDSLTSWIIDGANQIKSKGYYPCLYTGLYFSQNYIDMTRIREAGIDLWVAAYRATKPDVECTMWQYDSQHKVSGISGNCDVNYAWVDYPSIINTPEKTEDEPIVEESKEEKKSCSFLDLLRKIFKF